MSPKEQQLAYWLSEAAIAIDPVIYDQLSPTGLEEKRLLGALIEKPERLPAESREAIVKFAKLHFAKVSVPLAIFEHRAPPQGADAPQPRVGTPIPPPRLG